jgi:hypothetical protein
MTFYSYFYNLLYFLRILNGTGSEIMLVRQATKHSPATCPMYGHKYHEVAVKWMENNESIAAKVG